MKALGVSDTTASFRTLSEHQLYDNIGYVSEFDALISALVNHLAGLTSAVWNTIAVLS